VAERTFIVFTFLKVDPAGQRREGEQGSEDSCGVRISMPAARAPDACDSTATSRLEPAAA